MFLKILSAVFIFLHGLVHFWYVILSAQWIKFKPEMGWTGNSWLLDAVIPPSTIRIIAILFYSIAGMAFVVSASGFLWVKEWSNNMLIFSAIFSSISILLFFDGSTHLLVQKGLIGLIINIVVILVCYFN
ncbi:MAG: hypothetical protein ACLFVR_02650 [Thiohalospira sp.]